MLPRPGRVPLDPPASNRFGAYLCSQASEAVQETIPPRFCWHGVAGVSETQQYSEISCTRALFLSFHIPGCSETG